MAARSLSAVSLGLFLVLILAVPGPALAAELRLTFQEGRVMLFARDVPLRQILAEWERVGGTRIVNRDGVPGSLVTLDLVNVPEARALAILLRPVAGYLATVRSAQSDAASQFARIIIMPGAASPAVASLPSVGAQPPAAANAGTGRPQVQRRVMSDGRVVSFVENPDRPGDISVIDEEQDTPPPSGVNGVQNMRVPGQMPQRLPPGQTSADPYQLEPTGGQGSGSLSPPGTTPVPSVSGTAAKPGTVIPGPKPAPQAPPKPPGI